MGKNKRFALGVSYIGTNYIGFQSQKMNNSIQEALEKAISVVADHPVSIGCAGRTDKGVHAMLQVIHFDAQSLRTEHQWLRGINANLPQDIRIKWVQAVPESFHARFSAHARGYVYLLNTKDDLFLDALSQKVNVLNTDKMQEAANYLVGEHDFHAFQSRHCQAEHAFRRVDWIHVVPQKEMIYVYIRANAFVHHMVRKIMAALIAVGEGKIPPLVVKQLLDNKDREGVPGQASAKGLFLREVIYSEEWNLPAVDDSSLLGASCSCVGQQDA